MRILWILPVVMVVACGDDPSTLPRDEAPVWVENSNFAFEHRSQFNSHASVDTLYFLGRNTVSSLSIEEGDDVVSTSSLLTQYDNNFQMPMNDQVLLVAGLNSIFCFAIRNPVSARTFAELEMSDHDPSFLRFNFPSIESGSAMLLDDKNRALIPYLASETNGAQSTVTNKLMLVQLMVVNRDDGEAIVVDSVEILETSGLVLSMHALGDYFFVTTLDETHRIDETGRAQVIDGALPLRRMFRVADVYFGVNFDQVYSSTNGLDWNQVATSDSLRQLKYRQVDGTSLAFHNSQIFKLELGESNLIITELDNEGLQSHKITSIAFFGEKAYVTTFSGVFEKARTAFSDEAPQ